MPFYVVPFYTLDRDPWLVSHGADPLPESPRCWRMERWPELTVAWKRSRELMEESRRLIDRSRWLVDGLRGFRASAAADPRVHAPGTPTPPTVP